MQFLDTNIFLRLLTRDDEEKATACLALFEQLETGAAEATTSTVVIAEICYVLSSRSHYQMQPAAIAERLSPLLHLKERD
jgi:predicted nucleic acid-binding protein